MQQGRRLAVEGTGGVVVGVTHRGRWLLGQGHWAGLFLGNATGEAVAGMRRQGRPFLGYATGEAVTGTRQWSRPFLGLLNPRKLR